MGKVLLATGGTGGHIYPALALAEELRGRGHELRFIGVFGSSEDSLRSRGFVPVILEVKGFVAKSPAEKYRSALEMLKALRTCAGVVGAFSPDIVIGFGGYSSFPTVLAAVFMGRRTLIHEQNVMPGESNKLLARMVNRVCVGFKDSLGYLPVDKTVWTGTPFREPQVPLDRVTAAGIFGLDPARKIILVFGGSQGAGAINRVFLETLRTCPLANEWQVIHSTGRAHFKQVEQSYAGLPNRSVVRPFIENIDEAYAACDLVVARSGAGTVTELGRLGIPGVIIPYPGAHNHQLLNARILERAGSVQIIEENSLSSHILGAKILAISTLSASRRHFQESMNGEFLADPARRLADQVEVVMGRACPGGRR